MANGIRKYKDMLIMEIINPLMENKGFTLKRPEANFWQWEIWIDEVYQYVQLHDTNGCIYLVIGRGEKHWPGEMLLPYMDNPRTNREQWRYGLFEKDGIGKEALFQDIFADCHDILEKYCDTILQECVEEMKNSVPNHHHFLRFQQEYDALSSEYYEKLAMGDQNAVEALESVKQYMEPLRGKPVAEVETELLGLAAAYEKKILEEYGGEKGVREEMDSSYICKVGKTKRVLNILVSIFGVWEKWDLWKAFIYSINQLQNR